MKAMVLNKKGDPFVMEERPDPVPGPGEAVARVLACGSGLTIHHARAGRVQVDYPIIIGHEVLGEIAAVGEGVTRLSEGDPVTMHCYLSCGHCYWCRIDREALCENLAGFVGRHMDGGYAEYIKLPAQNFILIPEELDYKSHPAETAVVCDAIVTPYKVVRRARIQPLETVAVFGAGGGVGIHMVMLARWAHARVIAVDIVPEKLEKCRELGAEAVIDASKDNVAEALAEFTGGRGLDVAIDFVSAPVTLEAGLPKPSAGEADSSPWAATRPSPSGYRRGPCSRKNSNSSEAARLPNRKFRDSLDLVARRELWPLVTETYKLEEAEKVHARLEEGSITGRAVIVMD